MLSTDLRKIMHYNKVFIHENNKRAIYRKDILFNTENKSAIRPKIIVLPRKKNLLALF